MRYVDNVARPGKFQANSYPLAAEMVWGWTLDGGYEEIGTVEYGPGWHAFVPFEWLDRMTVLAHSGPDASAAIVWTDSQGFVLVIFYEDHDDARRAFEYVAEEYETLDDELDVW